MSEVTKRPLLVYATAFHNPVKAQIAAPFLTIDLSDKDGFYEIIRNIKSEEVDVFVHSPGGSAEATESVVKMLRKKFSKIRFIVTGAAKELKEDPSQLPVWIPILQEFAPSLLVECDNFIGLSRRLVTNWLTDYMFKGEKDIKKKVEKIADYLTDEKNTLSHARRIDAEQLQKLGVKI